MLQHVAGDQKIGIDALAYRVTGADHLYRYPGSVEPRGDRALHLVGETFRLALRGLVAELDPDRQFGVHSVRRVGHLHLVAHRLQIRRLVGLGFLQIRPAEFGARAQRLLQAVLGAVEKPCAQLVAQVLNPGLEVLLCRRVFGRAHWRA